MHNNLFSARRLLIFSFFVFGVFSMRTPAQFVRSFTTGGDAAAAATVSRPLPISFINPVTKQPNAGCAAENLKAERFVPEMALDERVRVCQAFDKITGKLNQTVWSPALAAELRSIWQTFSNESVTLRPLPKETSAQVLAMAVPFPAGSTGDKFEAAVYVRSGKSDKDAFFPVMLHELRHVFDFYETWKNKTALDSMEVERRAFALVSKLMQETPEREKFRGASKLWKESWRNRPAAEISLKRAAAIDKYLRGRGQYLDMARDPNRRTLDFTRLKTTAVSDNRQLTGEYNKKEKGERVPPLPPLPPTAAVLPQNIREMDLNLEKPKNPRDEKEILRVALGNEKKLYYGMSNFVYDQKLAFQCLKAGKVSASFAEDHTIARAGNGAALFTLTAAPALPCVLNYQDLETDFTNTFWASPALEKMAVYFNAFEEVEGKTLARYTVLAPDARLFAELAKAYPQIRPFRVIVGTIYISPEDGQIVRFAGTSFPEENVTGVYAEKVRCTYWVKAVRQKLNIRDGLWVTVQVGAVAAASVEGKVHPFNYTVKFENYRQSETDIKILDDDAVVAQILAR